MRSRTRAISVIPRRRNDMHGRSAHREPEMEQMDALDASFLDVEDAVSHMHIGSVGIFEGPAPSHAQLRRMLLGKLALVPRYRHVVRSVPLSRAGRCGSTTCTSTSTTTCAARACRPRAQTRAAPAGRTDHVPAARPIQAAVGDVDRRGSRRGRWALISKIHHCMVDGVAGTDLISILLDQQPIGAPPAEDTWTASAPAPRGAALREGDPRQPDDPVARGPRAAGAGSRARTRRRGRTGADAPCRRDRPAAALVAERTSGTTSPVDLGTSAAGGDQRGASALGGTVNDVVLACITGGFRRLLIDRGEPVDRVVRTLVPVSVRSASEQGAYNNRVSAMFADLPVNLADPLERLASIRAQMADLKQSHEAVAGEVLTSLSGFAPPLLLALARAPRHPRPPAQRQHGDNQRSRPPASAVRGRPAHARVVPLRSARRTRSGRRCDLLL